MTASVGETVGNTNAAASIPSTPSPAARPAIAVRIGSPAAYRLPNPISSTTIATAIPISSEVASDAAGRAACPSAPP